MNFTWQRTPEQAFTELAAAYAQAIQAMVRALAERYAPEIESWMKQNAIWTDRTSNARQTLITDIEEIASSAVILILAHGVDYGVYLELANHGYYGIIGPALDHFAPRIWNDIVSILRA